MLKLDIVVVNATSVFLEMNIEAGINKKEQKILLFLFFIII
ncbi:hypothetical protein M2372_004233 [Chryseobacterium sp. BIGb0232]|nr:hypothetical protein [Chryseobacterium sp. BIGb0232]ROS20586.1 hypothetical protein EDF65_1316 [Chryseobacterium nakagawai]